MKKEIVVIIIILACISLFSYGFLQNSQFFYTESKSLINSPEYNSLIKFENYSFSFDDKNILFIAPDGWGPMLVFDSETSYQQINNLIEKYFDNLNISWRIMYDERYMNYILYSTDKNVNDDIIFFENQSCYCYNPALLEGMNILENPKISSNGTISYVFSLICSANELDKIISNDRFKNMDISETALVYLFPEDGKIINNSVIISRLNNINDNENSVFVLKANTGRYYPQIFKEKILMNNSERLSNPSVYFKLNTPDEEINDILEKNIPEGVPWKIHNEIIYANYYFDCSKGNLIDNLEMLDHFNDIIIYENYYYEKLDFEGDNAGKCYYPVTILANEGIIVREMEKMGISLKKTKGADVKYQPLLNSSQINNDNCLKNIYSNENVVFIIKEFCTYCS